MLTSIYNVAPKTGYLISCVSPFNQKVKTFNSFFLGKRSWLRKQKSDNSRLLFNAISRVLEQRS